MVVLWRLSIGPVYVAVSCWHRLCREWKRRQGSRKRGMPASAYARHLAVRHAFGEHVCDAGAGQRSVGEGDDVESCL